jgi:solute carrier family 25 uncoupling protein 8/9
VPPAPPASPPRALLPPWQREWLAASMGCTIADAMFNPLEVLKVRRQMLARRASSTTASNAAAAAATASATAPPTGTLALARDAIKSRGLANGLWLPGLEATCYRAFSYTGFRIGMYPSGASHALVPIRPRRRGERRSLRTFFPAHLSAHTSLSIPTHLDAFQLQLTPFNSTRRSLVWNDPQSATRS